ncbi:MAG: Uncharacterised protein [Owenweeksia sp. TMED14]|nr:MAG: Uncharacterised protein [Owenweeksia sp. TMED14]
MKERICVILKFTIAIFLIFGGFVHFIDPTLYIPFVPLFLPFELFIIYTTGFFEIFFGIALLSSRYSSLGASGFFF